MYSFLIDFSMNGNFYLVTITDLREAIDQCTREYRLEAHEVYGRLYRECCEAWTAHQCDRMFGQGGECFAWKEP